MAIKMRRGNYADLDDSKLVEGEFAVCLDNGYVFVKCGSAGTVQLGTADTIAEALEMAQEYAEDAEAWAIGERNGTPVTSEDDTYENNAKYYAGVAEDYKDEVTGIVEHFEDQIPTANVVKPAGSTAATITITDKEGTTTATVYDGAKGDKGDTGNTGATGRGVSSITMSGTGKQHPITATYTDGTSEVVGTVQDGADGTGSGDMTKATYDQNDNGFVDNAEAVTDGTNRLTYNDIVAGMTENGVTEEELRDTVGWTGKNLLHVSSSIVTTTENGVTFTVTRNSEGEVTEIDVDTNSSASTGLADLVIPVTLSAGSYIISGCPSNGGDSYRVDFRNSDGSGWTSAGVIIDTGSGKDFTLSAQTDASYYIRIGSGQILSHKKFYPMFRYADITDSTYEPYHKSVEAEIEQVYADNGVLGAKNLIRPTVSSGTLDGLTFTINSDNTITVSGTATETVWFDVFPLSLGYVLPKGSYILSGCPSGGGNDSYSLRVLISGGTVIANDEGSSASFTINSDTTLYVTIRVKSGTDLTTPITIKPMIRLATDPDTTYQPYAMTNKELTDKVNEGLPIASANTLGAIKVGNNLSIDGNGVLSASGGGGAWSSVTGKPFSSVNSDDFRTTNDTLALPVPHYYVEVNGDNLSGTYQTENEPIVLPDGCLNKPFELTIKNVGTTKDWRCGRVAFTSNTRTLYKQLLYVKESSSNTVYSVNVIKLNSKYTVSSVYEDQTSFAPIGLARNFTQGTKTYLGGTYTVRYDPRYADPSSNFFISQLETFDFKTGMRVVESGTSSSESGGFTIRNVFGGNMYLLYTYEYNASTEVYRGHHAYYIVTPIDANGNFTAPVGVQMAGSSNTGVTVTYTLDGGYPSIGIKASSSSYYVKWVLLEVNSMY